jgi:glyoxylase-like metal-dependent hydrolase (beta-lactamase superfamily II)
MDIFPELTPKKLRWDVLVIGHLFWNRYFGESPDNPPRGIPSTCSSVLIRSLEEDDPYCLIVDPATRRSPEEFYFDLNRRTGLHPGDITHCFVTHHHFDHWHGLAYFPNAEWLTGLNNRALITEAVSQSLSRDPGDGLRPEIEAAKLREVSGEFLPGVFALPLPGHTADLRGLAFMSGKKRILAAGDAVMTADHFRDRLTEFTPSDEMKELAAAAISNIAESFDIIIPGHDNLIVR